MIDQRLAFGLHFSSDLALPELASAPADSRRPCVRIRTGAVETTLPGATRVGATVQVCGDTFLLDQPRVARYLVRNGVEIVVDPAPGASPSDVRLFLLGTAAGVLCYQRGLQPIHASAVDVNGRGVAFVGGTGLGKSTLAAYLCGRGCRALGDDLCVVSVEDDGSVLAWPGVTRAKLCEDALSAFGHDRASFEPTAGERPKYDMPIAHGPNLDPVPLDRIYVLGRDVDGSGCRIARSSGRHALEALLRNFYRPRLLAALGVRQTALANGLTVLKQATVYAFDRRWGFDVFAEDVAALERHVHEADR